jgi:hypothetical protein
MSTDPSTLGGNGNGKDSAGRFAKGNKLGRGNPLAGRAAKIRAILLKALTPADAKAIAAELVTKAKTGDLAYIRELLDRTIGKPSSSDLLERIEALEQAMGTAAAAKERETWT